MAQYLAGETVHHMFSVYINGVAGTTGNVTGLSGSVYVDGVLSSGTAVTIASMGSGRWRASYSMPAGLSSGADLQLFVVMTAAGVGKSVTFHDQFLSSRLTEASIRNYIQTQTIDVDLTSAAVSDLVSQISTGGLAAEDIAYEVIKMGVSDVIAEAGPIDRHSLGTLVLIATNADTTSNPGYLTVRHPSTETSLFQFTITTGAGCPIQSVT